MYSMKPSINANDNLTDRTRQVWLSARQARGPQQITRVLFAILTESSRAQPPIPANDFGAVASDGKELHHER